jgi:hypothetical protein
MAEHTIEEKKFTICKHRFPCNTLTHSINEDLLNIKRKGDPDFFFRAESSLIQSSCRSFIRVIVPYEISKINFSVETKILVSKVNRVISHYKFSPSWNMHISYIDNTKSALQLSKRIIFI